MNSFSNSMLATPLWIQWANNKSSVMTQLEENTPWYLRTNAIVYMSIGIFVVLFIILWYLLPKSSDDDTEDSSSDDSSDDDSGSNTDSDTVEANAQDN